MSKKGFGKVENSILIAGLGISGLITACLLAKHAFSVKCFEPISKSHKKQMVDRRTTAFLNPAVEVFKEIGVWAQLAKFAQPLTSMEIIDISNSKGGHPTKTLFNAKEMG